MYYWSRWTSSSTTEEETRSERTRETRPSWRDTAPRLVAQRETRPVVVVTRSRTQTRPVPFAYHQESSRERETGDGISLDIQRSTHAFSSATRSQNWYDATTQPVIEAFRLK